MVVAIAGLASACRSLESAPPATSEPRLVSADFAAARRQGTGFTLEFEFSSLPLGASRKLRIASDGRCEGRYVDMGSGEMEDGPRAGSLSPSDRTAILTALRDAPFEALERVPVKKNVIDGEPVSLTVAIGERRLHIDRQLDELRAAGLEPLCRLLVAVLAHLPRER
jgi:hypothetical protein